MRHLNTDLIYQAVYDAICKITFECDPMLHDLIQKAQQAETKALPQEILGMILSNHRYAAEDRIPLCQDTGSTVVFAEIGEEIHLYGKALDASIQVATRDAQRDCPLRASIVLEPLFDRVNSRDNSPAVIHTEIVPGDKLRLLVAQKGGGAENMSFMKMMSPSSNVDSILDFITEGVITAGSRPCPPLILGIGIGGNFETAPLLAKKALFLSLEGEHSDPRYAELERRIVRKINHEGCGAQGYGGRTTVLSARIIDAPCHIASLPVAVNIQCHAHRHKEIIL
jgi:fumarate hydratase subunit alpha